VPARESCVGWQHRRHGGVRVVDERGSYLIADRGLLRYPHAGDAPHRVRAQHSGPVRDLQERERALGFGVYDVRHRYFIATANALSMYAVSWTLIHAAQQFSRGDITTIIDGSTIRTTMRTRSTRDQKGRSRSDEDAPPRARQPDGLPADRYDPRTVGELASAFEFTCKNAKHEAEVTSPSSLRNPL
jgi:hypothetical protein